MKKENEEKKKGGKAKSIVLVLVFVVIILAAVSQGEKNGDVKKVTNSVEKEEGQNNSESVEEQETEEEKLIFAVGETAEQNGVQITLTNVTESAGNEFLKPESGKIYILMEFDITNNSNDDINISSIANFEAYCDDYSINQSLGGLQAPEASGKNQLDGSVASGKKMNGIIAYEVPSDYKKIEINVSTDIWSGKDIQFVYEK